MDIEFYNKLTDKDIEEVFLEQKKRVGITLPAIDRIRQLNNNNPIEKNQGGKL